MPQGILFTFLELADATSLNLEFSHLDGVHISYGEETITESNLLAIRRRHQNLVRVHTFTRRKEAQVGADWEWHLVGQKYTLSMRVQAKRVQSDGKLKIKHKIRSTGLFQYDQLMSAARANNMMPIYCIYCTAPQRSKWKHQHYSGNCREYQTGCLLAAADHVPNATVRLDQIESMSIPWHYLFFRADVARCRFEHISIDREDILLYGIHRFRHDLASIGDDRDDQGAWNHPTIDDLNGVVGRDFDRLGVHATDELDHELLSPDGENEDRGYGPLYERIRERGVQRVLVIDVRDEMDSSRRTD